MNLLSMLPAYDSLLLTAIALLGLLGIRKNLLKLSNEGYSAAVDALKEQVEAQKLKIQMLEEKLERLEYLLKGIHASCVTDGCLRMERQHANNRP